MSVVWMMNGRGTHNSMPVGAKVTTGPNLRVAYSTSPAMSSPSYTSSASISLTNAHAKVNITGLSANTRYWWRVEDNGTLDNSITGTFKTDPVAAGQPASFTVCCVGDAGATPLTPGVGGVAVPGRMSNHTIFDLIRTRALAEDWLMLAHIGDICYYDLGSGNHGLSSTASAAQYRSMWNDIMAQPRQHELYRSIGFSFMHDDHDYGPNNSDSTSPGRNNYLQVYREILATPTLPASSGNPVYHSWQIGRVLFILSDTRSARVPGSTMLGSAQLSWTQNLLATSTASALVWLMPTPWLGLSSDTWAGYPSERSTIVGWLQQYGWTDRMWMINADAHCLTMTSPGGNPHGGFPVALCAALDATPHTWTAQYDMGMYPGRDQYATVRVDDTGGDLALTTTLWRRSSPIIAQTVIAGGSTRVPAGSPSHVLAL